MKFLIIPDSFKGSMTSKEFCFMAKSLIDKRGLGDVIAYPIADGGEGTVENIVEIFDGKMLGGKVHDGNNFTVNALYGVQGDTAYVAVANSSGLPNTLIKNPIFTTTYGMGEQIMQALNLKKKHIVLCLGGSSTNDCGAGMLAAMGVKFFDKDGNTFVPTGGTLKDIVSYDTTEFESNIKGVTFTALCDVTNPLYGEFGCSKIYARQKGAKDKDIEILEDNVKYFADLTARQGLSPDTPGCGAAGGLGYAILAFCKGNLISGIEWFLNAIEFEKLAFDADYIVTGEGRLDNTSFMGKVVGGIVGRSRPLNKKITVFCGECKASESTLNANPIESVNPLNKEGLTIEENIARTKESFEEKFSAFLDRISK